MDWFILLLLVPLALASMVLLCGFAGCRFFLPGPTCSEDTHCPAGSHCGEDGICVEDVVVPPPEPPEIPLRPAGLVAEAISDSEIRLTWQNTDPATPDSYQVERHAEGEGEEDFVPIPGAPLVTTETSPDPNLPEGATFFYRVRACSVDGCSEPFEGDKAAATTFPLAPFDLKAEPIDVNRIDLTWTSNSAKPGVEFSLEHRASPSDPFTEIFQGSATTFAHTLLTEGSSHEYRVSATLIGLQEGLPVEVRSTPSATVQARTWAVAFQATLTTDQTGLAGYCLVQRIPSALLSTNPAVPASGTRIKITVRGSTAGSLMLRRIYVSHAAAGGDAYDSIPPGPGVPGALTPLLDLGPNTTTELLAGIPQTFSEDFAFVRDEDLLVAFDVGSAQGNVRYGTVAGSSVFYQMASQEAATFDRTSFTTGTADLHYLVEKIEVS